jgi:soluble lytic murein transglycosylase-like protein
MFFRIFMTATYAGIGLAFAWAYAKPEEPRAVTQTVAVAQTAKVREISFIRDARASFIPTAKTDGVLIPLSEEKVSEVIKKYGNDIKRAAHTYNLNPRAIAAVLLVESRGNPNAVSEAGARGCMQVLPSTEKMIGLNGDIFDCQYSIYVGTRYLAYIRDTYKFDKMYKVFAAYHDGPDRVARYDQKDFFDHPYLESIHRAIEMVPQPQYW